VAWIRPMALPTWRLSSPKSSASRHFGLVLLELGGDVALGRGEGLAALVVFGNPTPVRVGNLEVIAEDLVVADLERANPGPGSLALLHGCEMLLAAVAQLAILVERRVEAGPNHVPLGEIDWRSVGQGAIERGLEVLERIEGGDVGQERRAAFGKGACRPPHLGEAAERVPQRGHLPRIGAPRSGPAGQPLQVPHTVQAGSGGGPGGGLVDQPSHGVQPSLDRSRIPKRR